MARITLKYESASAILSMIHGDTAKVISVRSEQKGLGHGRRIMELVVEYAEAHGLDLWLEVQSYGRPRGLDNKQLVEFYQKFGFHVAHNDGNKPIVMHRKLLKGEQHA